MRKCDYCDEEIEYGYLIDDYYVMMRMAMSWMALSGEIIK